MRHCVLEDSSFLIGVMDKNDPFHKDAVFVFRKLLEHKNKVRIVIPSLVFFETITVLFKKAIDKREIEKKLWNFLFIEQIINLQINETTVFKFCKRFIRDNNNLPDGKSTDFIIANIGMDYNAQILTFDTGMHQRIKNVYDKIYFCSNISSTGKIVDETAKFIADLESSIKN